MALESIGLKLITGVSLGAQYLEEEVAEDYYYTSFFIIDLLIISIVFEFSKPVTK
jgi:hypothetical protein